MADLFDTGANLKTKAVAPWYGSNRMLAPEVGKLLRGCSWVGIPFGGGMSELAEIGASSIVVSDLHRHIINLCIVIKSDDIRAQLIAALDRIPFHPDALRQAQDYCRVHEPTGDRGEFEDALAYFVSQWMGRSGLAGTEKEFDGNASTRWNSNGGDSNTRFRSAAESLKAWGEIMRRCNFVCQTCWDFLDNCNDTPEVGIYCDPPFPGPGDKYLHKFTEADHRRLADRLLGFTYARIVCRFYDVPLIREIYIPERWRWVTLVGRTQANKEAAEVLLVRNG